MPARNFANTRFAAAFRLIALAACLTLQTGCGLLDTDQPNIIDPGDLDTPEGAEALRIGAIRDFAFVKDGDGSQFDTEGLLVLTGDMADEFQHSGFIPSTVEFDQRLVATNNGSLSVAYFDLQHARVATEGAAFALQTFATDPDNNSGIPEMLSLAGFTYIYFGEDFCSGVPYSDTQNGVVVPGGQTTTTETFRRALERFDSALAMPSIGLDLRVQYMAQVGKARAHLFLREYTEAAQAVQGVPTNFQYLTEHDPSPLQLANAVFIYGTSDPTVSSGGSISLADVEGGNGLPFRTDNDARVPFVDTGHLGLDQTTPQFDIIKYDNEGASVVVADGIEARLIEAEERLSATDVPGMMTILQNLRATAITPALPVLGTPAGVTDAADTLFKERAYWMYATGHRLGDLRRLIRDYGRTVNTVYPIGTYLRGGSYGTLVSFPVPVDEDPNPNFDRSLCDPSAP